MRTVFCTAFVSLALFAVAAHAEIACPDTLQVSQNATAPPGQWQLSQADRLTRLIGVTIYDGLPASNKKVRPTSRRTSGRTMTIRWALPHSPRGHYLHCSYELTTARLYTALPPGVKYCEVAYDLDVAAVGGHPVKRTYCQ